MTDAEKNLQTAVERRRVYIDERLTGTRKVLDILTHLQSYLYSAAMRELGSRLPIIGLGTSVKYVDGNSLFTQFY